MDKIKGLGFHIDLNHFDEQSMDFMVEKLKKLKTKWIRLDIDWQKYHNIENRKALQLFCQKCAKANIKIVGLLSQFIPATLQNIFFSHKKNTPIVNSLATYIPFIEQLVIELKNEVKHWEVWNEQNSKRFWINTPSPKEYVFFLEKIKSTIHKKDPTAKIIFGGINGNDITPMLPMPESLFHYKDFLKKCIDLGALKHVDYLAFHPYILSCYFSFYDGNKILNIIKDRINDTKKRFSEHSLLITEIGVSPTLNFKLKPKDIAKIYTELIAHCETINIPVCFYILVDPHPNHYSRFNPDRDFGLIDHNLKEKNLYHEILKNMALI